MGKRKIITAWSQNHLPSTIFFIYTIFSCFCLLQYSARDTITVDSLLGDGETLVSTGERFELGFFSPSEISADVNQYVGIWYYKSNPRIVVWVANRDRPIRDNNETGVLAIEADGNLKLVGETSRTLYFNTNVESSLSTNRVAQLMDSGNLVLRDNQSATSLWESFKKPTDTFLAGMTMDESLSLTSWNNQHDPRTGNFTFTRDQGVNQYQIRKNIFTCWRGTEDDEVFNHDEIIPNPVISLLSSNFSRTVKPTKDSIYTNLNISTIDYNSTRLVMNVTGEIQFWIDKGKGWSLLWKEPRDHCSVFHYCGNFGSCNSSYESKCKCLPGFAPKSLENWNSGEFSDGCERKSKSCDGNNKFVRLKVTKAGNTDTNIQVANETKCSEECRKQCRCQAYSFEDARGLSRSNPGGPRTCWIWTEDLYDLQEDITNGNRDVYVRVVASDIGSGNNMPAEGGNGKQWQDEALNGRNKEWALFVGVTTACVFILSCTIIYLYIRRKKATNKEDRTILRSVMVGPVQFKEEDKQGIDLPFFDLESILAATDNFSEANKLGKGGFGPVYKGKFSRGQEMAIKRLSSVSGQGMEEFKNEVVLIARLQHRNLVRLLGYCIESSEKILLYEYMPNKSLDLFLFDGKLSLLLDWEMRFNIILGIARGLLYLHQDSRLRIIHRDLKTSNVLLDQEMNPKISDFGLARIFEGKQTEGTTNRVVGTYGYMSPEYALDGFFSFKSDVFSFGVVVLEIISGKKNTGFYNSEEALSLLGYAWRLWQNNRALEIMDEKVRESCKTNEILKCINVGLLCVQENPNDRPTMSNIIVMLGSEAAALSVPKQPAFVIRGGPSSMGTESSSTKLASNAELTITLEAR